MQEVRGARVVVCASMNEMYPILEFVKALACGTWGNGAGEATTTRARVRDLLVNAPKTDFWTHDDETLRIIALDYSLATAFAFPPLLPILCVGSTFLQSRRDTCPVHLQLLRIIELFSRECVLKLAVRPAIPRVYK